MFKIGEFAKIATVPMSQLRYYDRIGLFQPATTDPFTGYRYYSATQLPALNRIIALKELGLTLEQIKQFVQEEVSAESIRGMLLYRKAQIEQTLQEEMMRLRTVETHLQQLERAGHWPEVDIVVKSVPACPFIGMRTIIQDPAVGQQLMTQALTQLPAQIGRNRLGPFTVVLHCEPFEWDNLDIEAGFQLSEPTTDTLALTSELTLVPSMLPAIETAVALAHLGSPSESPAWFGTVASWIEANGYTISGPIREVFVQPPQSADASDAVTEVQFPVTQSHP